MWREIPMVVVHEKRGNVEQWRLRVCDDHGRGLCSRVYRTSEAVGIAQRELVAILRGLDGELVLRALDHWMRGGKETAKPPGLDDEDLDA